MVEFIGTPKTYALLSDRCAALALSEMFIYERMTRKDLDASEVDQLKFLMDVVAEMREEMEKEIAVMEPPKLIIEGE